MPPAVGLGLLGAGLVGSTVAGGIGAASAAKSARRARNAAQQSFDYAQTFRPDIYRVTSGQQGNALENLIRQANLPQQVFNPTVFTPEQEQAAQAALIRQSRLASEPARQALVESSARRGLFRSGIGAQQEREFQENTGRDLNDALLNLQLQFANQRAQENARAFTLNQGAAQQRFGQLGGVLNAQNSLLGNQQDIYSQLLGYAQGQAGNASQQRIAANQALTGAISAPFNALGTIGLLGATGGLGGFGSSSAPAVGGNYSDIYNQQSLFGGTSYPGLNYSNPGYGIRY